MSREKWVVTAKRADFKAIAQNFGIDQVTARLIRNRDVEGEDAIREYLYGGLSDLHDPMLMKGMESAADILAKKAAGGARVRIIGDYDIDGVMSAYILQHGFENAGIHADVRIPDRMIDGYGISTRLVEEAVNDGVDTIVTCDNGISAVEQVALAKQNGITVVITDHHSVPENVPEADTVIDPHQEDCPYPYKELCGAGVAYKFVCALYRKVGINEEDAFEFLPYAAFATIGDIVDLTGENRILVKEGLKRLKKTENTGLLALCRVCGITTAEIDPYRIGFVLGPCINAGGRLDTAMLPLDLLNAESEEEADRAAMELHGLNEVRKELTDRAEEEACAAVEQGGCGEKVFVIFLPDCHESIAGITAGRVREKYGHPVFVLTRSGEVVKGSGRSTENYSMFEELEKCSDFLLKFGGHPMAAGLTVREEDVDALRERLNKECPIPDDGFFEKIKVDAAMPVSYVTEKLIREMELLEPCGKGNPRPLFAEKNVTVRWPKLIGTKKNVLKMRLVSENGRSLEGICFRDGEKLMRRVMKDPVVMIAYYPQISEYNGNRQIQAVITHFH